MNRSTLLIALIFTLCYAIAPIGASAQDSWIDKLFGKKTQAAPTEHPELTELTVDENLLIPELTDKQAIQARKIQKKEADRIESNRNIAVELIRDDEVIQATIPASLLFAPNETSLLDSSDAILRTLLPCLRTPDYYHVLLVMHSDNTGNEEYNYAITTERVFAIYDWFESNGGCVEYVVPYAAGAFEPIKPNNTVAGRNANRRLEIYIIPAEQMFAK